MCEYTLFLCRRCGREAAPEVWSICRNCPQFSISNRINLHRVRGEQARKVEQPEGCDYKLERAVNRQLVCDGCKERKKKKGCVVM